MECCSTNQIKQCRKFLADDFFRSFTDESRIMVLLLLMENGEMTVNQVSEQVHINQSNVSRHLAFLHRAGVTKKRREGQKTWYRPDFSNIAQRLKGLLDIVEPCCGK